MPAQGRKSRRKHAFTNALSLQRGNHSSTSDRIGTILSFESEVPTIRKAALVTGRTLTFRNAITDDAEFIFRLRSNLKLSRHLTAISPSIEHQYQWLNDYGMRIREAYFIIEFEANPVGTVRLYDQQLDSFCWGSWLLTDEAPSHAGIESALMVYSYALDHLGFTQAHFDVRKENSRVRAFHERCGARPIKADDENIYFKIDNNAIRRSMGRYAKYLPIRVQASFNV